MSGYRHTHIDEGYQIMAVWNRKQQRLMCGEAARIDWARDCLVRPCDGRGGEAPANDVYAGVSGCLQLADRAL